MPLDSAEKSHSFLISAPIEPDCFFTVVVPARDEAENLPKTLKSFSRQVDANNRPLDFRKFEIIFLVNNTSDDSVQIISRWQRENSHLKIHLAEKRLSADAANIGYVRCLLMNEAFFRLRKNRIGGGIIATTDADTEIAPNWIAANVAEIRRGADAVGGRILIHPAELKKMDSKCRAYHLRDTGYRLMAAEIETYFDDLTHDSLPRHHQHFNGSFAVTTAAFARAGGVPKVKFLEDVAFYHSLLRVDARFRHSPSVRVQTSARDKGRTESGLSTQISEWTIMGCNGDDYFVESARAIERRLRARKNLRDAWQARKTGELLQSGKIQKLADDLFVTEEFLTEKLDAAQTFGGFYEEVLREQNAIGEWARENPLEVVEKAIYELRLMLEKSRRAAPR